MERAVAETEELILHRGIVRTIFLFLCSAGFVAAGILLFTTGNPLAQLIGIANIAFFGLCAIAAIVTLIPGRVYLRLTPEGFQYRTAFRTYFVPWRNIESFGLLNRKSWFAATVGWRLRESSDTLSLINRRVAGCDGSFGVRYGKKPEELLAIMNEWKQRYTLGEPQLSS